MVASYENPEAPFNMAVATLMRLDSILQHLRSTDYRYPFDSAEKQKQYLGLVKQFYINSIPLLKEDDAKRFDYVLNINIKKKSSVKNRNEKTIPTYDPELDLKLNKVLIELQQLLRRYFMPTGKDLTKAVARFN